MLHGTPRAVLSCAVLCVTRLPHCPHCQDDVFRNLAAAGPSEQIDGTLAVLSAATLKGMSGTLWRTTRPYLATSPGWAKRAIHRGLVEIGLLHPGQGYPASVEEVGGERSDAELDFEPVAAFVRRITVRLAQCNSSTAEERLKADQARSGQAASHSLYGGGSAPALRRAAGGPAGGGDTSKLPATIGSHGGSRNKPQRAGGRRPSTAPMGVRQVRSTAKGHDRRHQQSAELL